LGMKLKTDMTPGVVGTALAAVAAGSLVLFSLVLQQSAFNPSSTNGLKALSPAERGGQKIIVEAAPEENDSAGGEATVAETTGSEETSAPTTGTESFSPISEDDDIIAAADDPPVGEFPNASGGTGNTVDGTSVGATANARGPQATISKDPNGRPGGVTLPDRNGPKNTAPPHGSNPDRGNDDSDDRADRDEPRNDRQRSWSNDGPKNDRQKSWAKDRGKNDRQKAWAKAKKAKNDGSRDKSSRDKNKSGRDKPRNHGKSNDNDRDRDHHSDNDRDRDHHSDSGDREDHESEDRNDRHDSRRDSDDDDDSGDDDDDDDDRHDDSHHSNDDSRGHSGSRDSKH